MSTTILESSATSARGLGSQNPRPRRRGPAVARALPLLPAVVLLAVFLLGPIIDSFIGAGTNSALTGPDALHPSWVGFKNFTDLFSSPDLPNSVLLTFAFVFFSAVVGQNVLGMVLAVLMRSGSRVVGAVVSTFVIGAWALPEIVAAFAAYAFFSPSGTFNGFLGWFGIKPVLWLYLYPMFCVVIANIWRGSSFSMLVYSAALQEIPPEITEAASVDGASGFKRFFLVSLPMIRRSISTNLMLITLQTLSVFTLIYVMTNGGPGNKSMTLPLLAYQEAFKFSQLGYGTAIATVLLVIGAVFAIVYIRVLKPEVD